jgi:hypothetical protein
VMLGAAAPQHWRQVAAHAAALLLLLSPSAAAAASDAGAGNLAGASVGSETPRRQLLASGSIGAGGIAGASAWMLRHRTVCVGPHVYIVMTAHMCAGLLA